VRRNPPSRLAALATALLITIGVGVARPNGVASAHAELVESVPASGQHLDLAPTTISLRFTESVAVLDDAVRVLSAADGSQIEIGAPQVDGSVVTADVPPLADGGYVIDWKVVSSDGHSVSGAITFVVGDAEMPSGMPVTASGGVSSSETALLATWRALTYAGLALVIGVSVMVLTLWPDGRRHSTVAMLTVVGAGVASVAAPARVATEAWVLEASVADLWDLRSGRAWLGLIVLGAASLAASPLLRSRVSQRALIAGAGVFVAAVGVAIAFAGHGASGRLPVLGTIATMFHVAAASVWVGGLAGLAVSISAAGPVDGTTVARRFSTLGSACVTALLLTGIIQSVRELRSLDAVTGSDFGVALLVKLVVVAALLGVAAVTRRRVRRTEPDGAGATPLRRLVGVELGLAVLVLGATGWLAGASPIADGTGGGPIEVTVSDITGEATVSIAITPGETGANTAHATFGHETALPDEVEMEVVPVDGRVAPVSVAVSMLGDHAMAAPFQIPYAGEWTVKINARYGDFTVRTFETIVEIE
jgi:copper transport protein